MQDILSKRKTRHQLQAEEGFEGVDLEPMLKSNQLLEDLRLTGFEDDMQKRLVVANHLMAKSGRITLKPILPLLLQLKGKPYHLKDHFPFEPFFRTRMSKMTLLKTGRQVSKSTSLASQGVLFSNCIPYFSTLYVTPLFEMIRRFSQNYVRPFIETSPVMKLFSGTTTINSVLQRSFKNRSQMIFSFAFLDAERTRGISADKNVIDEVQDMDIDFLPIIHETMSGSVDWGLTQYAGTPKTLDNTIERLWLDSSMAEWVVKCPHGGCGHWNIPALEFDLIEMIGPMHDFISEKNPGVVCAKCRKPVNPRPPYQGGTGRWVHRVKSKRWSFAGYHVPQIVMPMHYANSEKWEVLLGKQAGRGNTPIHVFFNEVCGESYDSGSKMVTITDLKRAAICPWPNRVDEATKRINEYVYRVCAVDWGGGGTSKKKTGDVHSDLMYQSYTSIAVMGMLPSGRIDVIYGFRSLHPHAHVREAKIIMGMMAKFHCSHLVHDYTGAGTVRETVIHQAGLPTNRIIPVALRGAAKGNIFQYKEATELHPRDHFQCDKPRSLNITAQMIKSGALCFFEYDHVSNDDPGLLHDFLNLIEEKSESRTGSDIYTVIRDPSGPDDFAQAVNLGTMLLCQMSGKWPDLSKYEDYEISEEALRAASPVSIKDWADVP
jgi:hypothetical protein